MKSITASTKEKQIIRNWHVIDAQGKILGRVASEIAQKLMGKQKPYFVKNLDCGDHVIVINCKDVEVTGRKEKEKMYGNYSGFPGGLKEKALWQVRKENPEEPIRHAVSGMLPKNKLRDQLLTRLYIYPTTEHPYKDQMKQS